MAQATSAAAIVSGEYESGGLRGSTPVALETLCHSGVSTGPGWTMETVTSLRRSRSSMRREPRKPRRACLAEA
jgi:hypothetical protein